MWWWCTSISFFNCIIAIQFVLGDHETPNNHVPTSVLSPTTINTNPTATTTVSSLLKTDRIDEYPQLDLNLNMHHHNHLAQQRLSLDQNDDDDDDDDDETNNQNRNGNSELSNR
jgi:hypothetical protein